MVSLVCSLLRLRLTSGLRKYEFVWITCRDGKQLEFKVPATTDAEREQAFSSLNAS